MKARAHIFVSGIVQGVFFRVETRFEAINRNVTGWIRNTQNGKVEAVFEGEKENVEKLIVYCRTGPPNARVRKMDVEWEQYIGEFSDFRIRRTCIS